MLFGGGIRGGKTFCGMGALILLCKMFPGSRWAIVRDSLPTLKRNTIPSFRKICPDSFCLTGKLDTSYNQETQTVTFRNKSQILFFAENFDQDKELFRWRGLEVNGFLLEEVNELNEKSFNKAIERAGSHVIAGGKQPIPLIIATMNPSQNWTKDRFYTPFVNGTLPTNWFYLTSKIFDNPFIPPEYIANLKTLPKHEYSIYVDGDWNVINKTGAEFYRSFRMQKNTIQNELTNMGLPELYDRDKPIHISFDENSNPYMTANIWQIFEPSDRFGVPPDTKRVFVQIDEICLEAPDNKIDSVCDKIKNRYNGHESGVFIYGDATSLKEDPKLQPGENLFTIILTRLRHWNPIVRVPASNPNVLTRGNFINSVFEVDFCGNVILIGSNCRNSVADYLNVKMDSDGTKKKVRETNTLTGISFERFGHTSDANDYFLINVMNDDYIFYIKGSPAANQKIVARSTLKQNRF